MSTEDAAATLIDLRARMERVSTSRPVLDVASLETVLQQDSSGFDSFSSIYALVPVLDASGMRSLNDFAALVARFTESNSIYPSVGNVSLIQQVSLLFVSLHAFQEDPALGVACQSCLLHSSRLVEPISGSFAPVYEGMYESTPKDAYVYCRAIHARAAQLQEEYSGMRDVRVLSQTTIQLLLSQLTCKSGQTTQSSSNDPNVLTPMDLFLAVAGPTDVNKLEIATARHGELHNVQDTVYSKRNAQFEYYPGVIHDFYEKDQFLSSASADPLIGVSSQLYEGLGNQYDFDGQNEHVALHPEPDTWLYGTTRFAKERITAQSMPVKDINRSMDVGAFLIQAQGTLDSLQKLQDKGSSTQTISRAATQVVDSAPHEQNDAETWTSILQHGHKLERIANLGMAGIDAVNAELGVMGGVSTELLPSFALMPRNPGNTHVGALQQEYRRDLNPTLPASAAEVLERLLVTLESGLRAPELVYESHHRPCVVYHHTAASRFLKLQFNAVSGVPRQNGPEFVQNLVSIDDESFSITSVVEAEKYIAQLTELPECTLWVSLDDFAAHIIPLGFARDEGGRWKIAQFESLITPQIAAYAEATEGLEQDRQQRLRT